MSSKNSLTLQIWSSLTLGALLVAYLASGRNLFRLAGIFALSLLLLALLFFGLVRLLSTWQKSSKSYIEAEKHLAAVCALSQQQAEEKALALLLDTDEYRTIENPISEVSLHSLGPQLQKFFSRFESARQIKGETFLDRNQIGPSSLRVGFLKIGTDIEHAEIVVRTNDDRIYAIDGTEQEDRSLEEEFPTIYHYILAYGDHSDSKKRADA